MIKDFSYKDNMFKIFPLLFWTHNSFYNIQSDYSK